MQLYVGITGSILCIIALAITLFKSGFGDSVKYKLLNLSGGSCLLYYAVVERAIPFIVLESIWVLLPLVTIFCPKLSCSKLTKSKA